MKRSVFTLLSLCLTLFLLLLFNHSGRAQPPLPDLAILQQDATGPLEITRSTDPVSFPSFIRGQISLVGININAQSTLTATTLAVANHYAKTFGIRNTTAELKVTSSNVDELGMAHVFVDQVYQNVPVYSAGMGFHYSADGQNVIAISNSFVSDVSVDSIQPLLTAEQSMTIAKLALPQGQLMGSPQLAIYPPGDDPEGLARLVWLVELRDDAQPARNIYVVDAMRELILHVINLLYEDRNRKTFDAGHKTNLPGTLKRSESSNLIGDKDTDNAHAFAGNTYDYFKNTHNRDSYDNKGAALISTVHYGNNYRNAFWNGSQMVYGDGFPVKDVIAHELAHAVTEHTAKLEYRWQSGALNESVSDIFGAMVDRDDWLMGEDLGSAFLGGRPAIRDMANPASLGQPAHVDQWVKTCSDEEGVHTNSGIHNKAYYNIATAVGKSKAERIFYRALVTYLRATSSLEDARAAVLQSAQDLYGGNSTEYNAVRSGFNAVGLDGKWNPPTNSCSCAASTALVGPFFTANPAAALQTAVTLYRVRDELLSQTSIGLHYLNLYDQHTGSISSLLLRHPDLSTSGAAILQAVTPGLSQLVNDNGDSEIVTAQTVTDAQAYLRSLANQARADGDETLAQTIEQEMERLNWDQLIGMTYTEAWNHINHRTIYLPTIVK